jgi:hypothetical protein
MLARDGAQVRGVIRTPATGVTPIRVTLIPEGRLAGRLDLLQTADPDDDTGAFHIDAVAPGDYRVFAWELADDHLPEFPEFVKALEAKGATVTLGSGEQKTVTLTPITSAEVAAARRILP